MEKLYLNVKVQPKAKKAGLEKLGPDSFRVRVQAAPEKGAANKEVIVRIASYFRVPASSVHIVRGAKSRIKQIAVEREEVPRKKKA